ncbi:META domain-containing protein [Herbiconiux sp. UC225_62]|uniref:META domain-containing protein n=1 Tax=Herbiconiux sp. UC225_62 TaxID=3350168 RepID=UPI0036D37B91
MTGRAVFALLAALTIATLSGCASSGAGGSGAGDSGATGDSSAGAADPVEGNWSTPEAEGAWLTLDGGSVTGSDGCNPVNGTYDVSGDEVTFDLELTTLKACLGVTLSFAGLSTGTLDADTLTLYDSQRTELVALTKG